MTTCQQKARLELSDAGGCLNVYTRSKTSLKTNKTDKLRHGKQERLRPIMRETEAILL